MEAIAEESRQNIEAKTIVGSPNDNNKNQADDRSSTIDQQSNDDDDDDLYHRPRTLYLIRHGQAQHNVLEAQAQQEAKLEAEASGLSEEETFELMETARKSVLHDPRLRDAPLTELGKSQAKECALRLQQLIDDGTIPHAPTEAMVSPLTRTLETCQIILDNAKFATKTQSNNNSIRAHVRIELQERQTLFPPDTARSRPSILKYTQSNFGEHYDRFVMNNYNLDPKDIENEAVARESKEMLRERASKLFDLLMEMQHRHVMIVSHKGYLREVERGLFGLTDSPLFSNAELRVYRVIFTKGDRTLKSLERLV